MPFIERNADRPFFLFLPTNAPHTPYWVHERYSRPYAEQGLAEPLASFYGMIENIDENFARLRKKLTELGIEDNTILIFMTDNGTAAGLRAGLNAGMRGRKGSNYDGGHRVPFCIRWPTGGIGAGRDLDRLAAHIDIVPTLVELLGLRIPLVEFDGVSLAPLLTGEGAFPKDRTHFIQHQQVSRDGPFQMETPRPFFHSAVLTNRRRLVNGEELYDITADPGQQYDIAAEHPQVVARLRGEYESWWADVTVRVGEYLEIPIGAEEADPVRLTSFDWYTGGPPNQREIQRAPSEGPWQEGFWAIEVIRAGQYKVTLRQQPREGGVPIDGQTAQPRIGDHQFEEPISVDSPAISFEIPLEPGKTTMRAWFSKPDGTRRGAFFAYVTLL